MAEYHDLNSSYTNSQQDEYVAFGDDTGDKYEFFMGFRLFNSKNGVTYNGKDKSIKIVMRHIRSKWDGKKEVITQEDVDLENCMNQLEVQGVF